MMADKLRDAREFILERIESGEFAGGEKLPSARDLAEQTRISFVIMQMAFISLVTDGVLYTVPRRGTFVRNDWYERILPNSFWAGYEIYGSIFTQRILPHQPAFRLSRRFQSASFEVRSTLPAASLQQHFLNLSEFFDAEFPGKEDFFLQRIEQFRTPGGKLFALPLIFSPRGILCNRACFQEAGCKLPPQDWNWNDFLDVIRQLRRRLPAGRIFPDLQLMHYWATCLTALGGKILEKKGDALEVALESEESRKALEQLWTLAHMLLDENSDHCPERQCAMSLCARQDIVLLGSDGYILPLPHLPGEVGYSVVAGDLFCVRNTVNDFGVVRDMIRILLSEEVQDELGRRKFGIPIRRSSAIRSFDESDPVDRFYWSSVSKIHVEPCLLHPVCLQIFHAAMLQAWREKRSVSEFIAEVAPVLRGIINYYRF